jgi:hypothetical protein
MEYRKEIYYQSAEGVPHKKVTEDELRQLIGETLADRILRKVQRREESSAEQELIPEVQAFFEGRLSRVVIAADSTNRGNVYVELIVAA